MSPYARRGDPGTSWAAADSVDGLTDKRRAVLVCLRWRGPMTDEQLAHYYRAHEHGRGGKLPRQSPSGLRTRRHELVEAGLVEEHGSATLESGREAIVWKATTNGKVSQ